MTGEVKRPRGRPRKDGLMPGSPEARAADPEADALHDLLDALHDKFGTAEFGAKDVMGAMTTAGFADPRGDAIRNALTDIAGDKAASTTRGIGRTLTNRQGRIAHGLRLTTRRDLKSKIVMFRVGKV